MNFTLETNLICPLYSVVKKSEGKETKTSTVDEESEMPYAMYNVSGQKSTPHYHLYVYVGFNVTSGCIG